MTISELAKSSNLDLAIAEAQGKVKVTRLPMRKARKNELVFTSGYRTTGVRAAGVKIRGGNGHNAGGKVG
mgnify:CR=1 FL=1